MLKHHPEYMRREADWQKWRLVYRGDSEYRDTYLRKYSDSESDTEFSARREISYLPNHSKRSVDKIKNAIFQRLVDVKRINGPDSYQNAVCGLNGGVDRRGTNMNAFMGMKVLPELLTMGKVYVYVDMPPITSKSILGTVGKTPYLYYYTVEDVINYVYGNPDDPFEFKSVVLRDRVYEYDEKGLPTTEIEQYRYLYMQENKVVCEIYNDDEQLIKDPIVLDIPQIPLVGFEITDSLLADIADHQIALLNLASSDMSYLLSANVPTYVEQFDPKLEMMFNRPPSVGSDIAGSASDAQTSRERKLLLGHKFGRGYPIGTETPGYISPPAEPVKVSMEKQRELVAEIERLLDLKMESLALTGEAKKEDRTGLEAGLSYIGLVLQTGEQKIASIWPQYIGKGVAATVSYPTDYSLKSDLERIEEATKIKTLKGAVPSKTYQKEMSKKIARTLLDAKIPFEKMQQIENEVENAAYLTSDVNDLKTAHQEGFATASTCSIAMGFAEGEAEKAKIDHAERLATIAISQSKGGGLAAAGARGVKDLQTDSHDAMEEKMMSRDNTMRESTNEQVRGEANEK
jgi:hypothetical protein